MTPYIFDDRVDYKDVATAIWLWWRQSPESRTDKGWKGHDWVNGNESNMSAKCMSNIMASCINQCFDSWTKRKRFTMFKIEQPKIEENVGII
jgi:hypothetical protein